MQNETRDPQDLKKRLHPALKRIPVLDEATQKTLRAALEQTGSVTDPVKLDADGRVATDHGRNLVIAACDLGFTTIPVQPTDLDVGTLIVDEFTQRRHLTKSAIAYFCFPHLKPAWESARIRQASCLKKGPKAQCSPVGSMEPTGPLTVEEFSKERGISITLLNEARRVHELFQKHEGREFQFTQQGGPRDGEIIATTLRDWFEPKIIKSPRGGEHQDNEDRPYSLDAVIKGCGYLVSGKCFTQARCPVIRAEQMEFWEKRQADLVGAFHKWSELSQKTRKAALLNWQTILNSLPPEVADATVDTIERRRSLQ